MKTVVDFFPNWTEALGWTLLNSLWQALAMMSILIIALRFIPSRLSQVRYIAACGALAFLLILNASTFIYILNKGSNVTAAVFLSVENPTSEIISSAISASSIETGLSNILGLIDRNMPLIILAWIIGTMIFSVRMLGGWWYVSKLKADAIVLNNEWSICLKNLAQQLQINRVITLAQSARIHTPVVMGLIKPVILVPVGMFSGLSTEQIETIFIHELAHIKRHDYFINLIQLLVEALYFFNPFIWIISTMIRREREYCCDDTVIVKHGSALAYARALTQLEEVRLSKSGFALSLAENKNQLLNRIKRLMEKSVKNYSGRDRLIPALLLVIGLICASWLTIRTERQATIGNKSSNHLAGDTAIKKNKKSAQLSKKTITRYDENGEPHEEIIEEFKGDEDLRDLMSIHNEVWGVPPGEPIWAIPAIPPIDFAPPLLPDIAPLMNFNFQFDTIPGKSFRWRSESEWKDFSEEFEKKFKERFSDFYKKNEKDFEKMMREMEEKFQNRFYDDHFEKLRDFEWPKEQEMKVLSEQLEKLSHEDLRKAEEQAMLAQEEVKEHMQDRQKAHEEQLLKMEQEMQQHAEQFKLMEDQMRGVEEKMKSFEKELKKELVKDGYIGSNDEIKNIHWDDDGEIEVNGKKIKESDKEKYQKLHREYFKEGSNFRYVE